MLTGSQVARFHRSHSAGSGCWLWLRGLDRDGYGVSYLGGRRGAHRVSWIMARGPVPRGLVLNHICRTRRCVNPAHLELVTRRENVFRNSEARAAINARKTHCPRGHPLEGRESAGSGRYRRICRPCQQAKQRRYRQRRKARGLSAGSGPRGLTGSQASRGLGRGV
jgi:hypothetical protein